MRVLIADDDQTIRALLADMLAAMGHEVLTAADGAEAVELALGARPDALILDFLMPRLSGLDALQAIRDRGLDVPAVLLSAVTDSSLRELEGFEAPEAVLEKPFRKRSVEKALEKALARGGRDPDRR